MAIQHKDGSFSETMQLDKAIEQFKTGIENGDSIKALHIGTFAEIEEEKGKADLEKRFTQLEQMVKDLTPAKTFLEIPTPDQIKKFAK